MASIARIGGGVSGVGISIEQISVMFLLLIILIMGIAMSQRVSGKRGVSDLLLTC